LKPWISSFWRYMELNGTGTANRAQSGRMTLSGSALVYHFSLHTPRLFLDVTTFSLFNEGGKHSVDRGQYTSEEGFMGCTVLINASASSFFLSLAHHRGIGAKTPDDDEVDEDDDEGPSGDWQDQFDTEADGVFTKRKRGSDGDDADGDD
jgi:hypothetical protein